MNRRNLLITSALKNELLPVKNGINILQHKTINIDYLTTGIGKDKTIERLNEKLEISNFDCVLNIGTAGSLVDDLKFGDIVFPLKFVSDVKDISHEVDVAKISSSNLNYKKKYVIYTSENPVNDKNEKDQIRKKTNADLVDMESYWLAQMCSENDISFFSIKVISDYAEGIVLSEFKKQLQKNAELLIEPVRSFLRNYNDQQQS